MRAASLSRPTWIKYAYILKSYRRFCIKTRKFPIWPVTESSLQGFILWCSCERNLSANTIQSYVSALATLHGLSNPGKPWHISKATQLTLRGLKNRSVGCSQKQEPDPLTFDVLNELGARLRVKKWPVLSKITVWACCTVGYFGAFGAGEILAKNAQFFDKFSDLLWSDIKFDSDRSVTITVKAPKVRHFCPQRVRFPPIKNKHFCPSNCLRTLKTAQQIQGIFNENLPVF